MRKSDLLQAFDGAGEVRQVTIVKRESSKSTIATGRLPEISNSNRTIEFDFDDSLVLTIFLGTILGLFSHSTTNILHA